MFNQISVASIDREDLQLLIWFVLRGNLNVAVCRSYSNASPLDHGLLSAPHTVRSADRKQNYFLSLLFHISQIHFASGCWSAHFWPHVCGLCQTIKKTNTLGHYYYYSSWFQGMLHSWPLWLKLHLMSSCLWNMFSEKTILYRCWSEYVQRLTWDNMYSALRSTTS